MNELIQQTEKLNLNEKDLHLCVDGLNIATCFFGIRERWEIPQKVFKKVSKFVKAANNSGYTLQIFIDASNKTDEAKAKWKTRRENEVTKGERKVPQGLSSLLGEMFQRCGVTVHYSFEADCDDTIVAYAVDTNAAILSADKDMFRYNRDLPVYSTFSYNNGYLVLIPHSNNEKRKCVVSKRTVITPPPQTTHRCPSFTDLARLKYIRGSPSPLTRQLGNLHITTKTLRQAAYYRLGIKDPVYEEFPTWSAEKQGVLWHQENVLPDNSLDHLLDDPHAALLHFFPSGGSPPPGVSSDQWWNHQWAMRAVVYEIIVAVTDGMTLLELMERHYAETSGKKIRFCEVTPKEFKTCKQCKSSFVITEREKQFIAEKGFALPVRCLHCRKQNRVHR